MLFLAPVGLAYFMAQEMTDILSASTAPRSLYELSYITLVVLIYSFFIEKFKTKEQAFFKDFF